MDIRVVLRRAVNQLEKERWKIDEKIRKLHEISLTLERKKKRRRRRKLKRVK